MSLKENWSGHNGNKTRLIQPCRRTCQHKKVQIGAKTKYKNHNSSSSYNSNINVPTTTYTMWIDNDNNNNSNSINNNNINELTAYMCLKGDR